MEIPESIQRFRFPPSIRNKALTGNLFIVKIWLVVVIMDMSLIDVSLIGHMALLPVSRYINNAA